MTPLEILRQRLEELRSQIDTKRSRATEILGLTQENLTTELLTEASNLRSELVGLHTQRDQLEAQIRDEEAVEARAAQARAAQVEHGTVPTATARGVGGATVTQEERTYSREASAAGRRSFFTDAFRATVLGDPNAQVRLARHAAEVAAEGETEARATTTGSFAGLVVPQYLVDDYALLLRLGRPTANAVNRLPLPDQGMQLVIPRGTTGATAASQATENTAVSSTDEVWANLTVNVATIAGQQDVSRQSLERGTAGIDQIVFLDLLKAYNAELDRQVLDGSGAAGQMLGIRSTAGVTQATAYTAAATAATFFSKTAGAVSAVAAAGTAIQPNVWVMHPRRWYWLASLLDSANRPLAVPNMNGVMNAVAVNTLPGGYSADNDADPPMIVGYFHGLPVIIDANVPTAVGSGPEDIVYLMDASQAYLWEDGGGAPRQLQFEQTAGGNLTVKLVLYGYAAFTAGRYPVAFALVGGNSAAGFGQIAPAF